MSKPLVIPGGQKKGTLLDQAETKDIQYWHERISGDLAANPNKPFADKDRLWLSGAEVVLEARKNGAKPAAKTVAPAGNQRNVGTQIQRQPSESKDIQVVGAFPDPASITLALQEAQGQYHIVAPAMMVGSLPPGFEVFTSIVTINRDPDAKETYKLPGGRLGLDRVALARIGQAAGVSWVRSSRTDDRSHPHYCAWEAIAAYKQFDGQVCLSPGNVDIDVREPDGPAYVEIVTKHEAKNEDPGKQLLELRKFLARHCESKAMNRAIANIGIRRSYTEKELELPFLVARMAFTGRTDDPRLRELFAVMIAQQQLGIGAMLYGQAPPLPQLPLGMPPFAGGVTLPAPQLVSPPPLGAAQTYDYSTGGDDDEPQSEPQGGAAPAAASTPAAQPAAGPAAGSQGELKV
jgi:hypothetical protein